MSFLAIFAIAAHSFAQAPAEPGATQRQQQPPMAEEATADAEGKTDSEFFDTYIHDKLQLGTRLAYRSLTDDDSGHKGGRYGSGTFLGTIYGLDEEQSYAPDKFYATYYFLENLGIELAYDRVVAETLATDASTRAEKTDGDVILSGPTLSLIGRYRNKTAFTPYGGIGLGFFTGDFDETEAWAHTDWGWAERDRRMVVDDTTALLLTAGVAWKLTDHWFVDGSMQYVKADADATFYGYIDGEQDTEQTGHFPLDNVALRLGVGFNF